MASQDLVGRPLVPFFDNDENVNDALQFAEGDDEREEMKIDARVWDKDLGYFVYPSEQPTLVTVGAEPRDSRTDSGKLLLTPSMMLSSRSAPNSLVADGNLLQAATDGARPHSSSVKRGSKPKTRSNTPGRRRKENEKVEDVFAANTSSRKEKSKRSNTNGNGTQSSNSQQSRTGKQKEQLSASGKWAWSAFQKSPDPTELPMPPFLIKPIGGLSNDDESFLMPTSPTLSPPRTPSSVSVQCAIASTTSLLLSGPPPGLAPQPPLPPIPTTPPEVKTTTAISAELSMTQDLRRMLNIGGG